MEEKELEEMMSANCLFDPKQKGIIFSAEITMETFKYVDEEGLVFVTSNQDPEKYWEEYKLFERGLF